VSRPRRSLIHARRDRATVGPGSGATPAPAERTEGPPTLPPGGGPTAVEPPLPTPTPPAPPPPGGAGAPADAPAPTAAPPAAAPRPAPGPTPAELETLPPTRLDATRPDPVFTPKHRMFTKGDRPPTAGEGPPPLNWPVVVGGFVLLGLAAAAIGAGMAGLSWVGLALGR
jgi:hypothetical protein